MAGVATLEEEKESTTVSITYRVEVHKERERQRERGRRVDRQTAAEGDSILSYRQSSRSPRRSVQCPLWKENTTLNALDRKSVV